MVAMLVCTCVTLEESKEFKLKANEKLCRPIKELINNSNQYSEDKLIKVIHEIQSELSLPVKNLLSYSRAQTKKLHSCTNSPRDLMTINDLENVSQSSVGVYISHRNEQEKLLHTKFAELVVLSAYAPMAQNVTRHIGCNQGNFNITSFIQTITRKFLELPTILGIQSYDKRICEYARNLTFNKVSREIEYAISIMDYLEKIVDKMSNNIQSLDSLFKGCTVEYSGEKSHLKCATRRTTRANKSEKLIKGKPKRNYSEIDAKKGNKHETVEKKNRGKKTKGRKNNKKKDRTVKKNK